jgi:uncharacterized membrane protein required for colicin V production
MTAIKPPPPENIAARKWVPVLLIGITGLSVSLALYGVVGGFQPIELGLMILIALFAAFGYNRGTVRGIITIVALYISTGFAALFYPYLSPYVAALQQIARLNLEATIDSATRSSIALTFLLLTLVIWVILEILRRVLLQDTGEPKTNILDNLGGVVVHVVVGFLIAALLFNAYGYGQSRPIHDRARLRPYFNQALYLHYSAQQFWFGGRPPQLYIYDLNAR